MNYESYLKSLIKMMESHPHPHTKGDSIILLKYKEELALLTSIKLRQERAA